MKAFLTALLVLGIAVLAISQEPLAQTDIAVAQDEQSLPETVSGIDHVIWVWFENRENTSITASAAPYFTSFAAAGVNFTNFYGVRHPSEPNYLAAFSGSTQGVTDDGYYTFPASTN